MADEIVRVVLVDDSRATQAIIRRSLGYVGGVEVVGTACDGAQGLVVIAETEPDLVLMDMVMPGMDGIEALKRLRDAGSTVAVAIVTSLAGKEECANEAFRCGAIQVLPKPFDLEDLRKLVESIRSLKAKDGVLAAAPS